MDSGLRHLSSASNLGSRLSGYRQTLKDSLTAEVRLSPLTMKAALTAITSFAAALPVTSAIIWVNDQEFTVGSFVVMGCVAVAVVASMPVLSRLRVDLAQQFETPLLPARRAASQPIRQFSQDVTNLPSADDLAKRLLALLVDCLAVHGAALYLTDPQSGVFTLVCSAGSLNAPPIVDGHGLIEHFNTAQSAADPMQMADCVVCPADQAGAQQLGWEACMALRAEQSCLGIVAVGQKRSGAAIDDAEVTLLTVVAAQAALALKHAECARQFKRQQTQINELQKRLEIETVSVREDVRPSASFKDIIGSSAALHRALALVEQAARSTASVLITGETGTGKELIARAIHELSPRRDGPLISVNCPVIPRQLAESELFGHERGAFTDAIEARPGKFELADGGTIFLDEVADLPLELQVKLLRVLQERETQRIGSRKVRKLDLRIVAATNRDLPAEVRAQRFREDLYYRLAAIVVHVPPLRERPDDIPMLASFFLDRAAAAYQQPLTGFTPDAMAALCGYQWPGNIRELQNVVERAVLLCRGPVIQLEHLLDLASPDPGAEQRLGVTMRGEKMRRIQAALAQTGGNKAAAARLLGISRSNLGRTIRTLGMQVSGRAQ